MKSLLVKLRVVWPIDAAGALLCAAFAVGAYLLHIRPETQARAALDGQRAELAALRNEEAHERELTASALKRRESAAALIAASPVQLLPVSRLNERISGLTRCAAGAGLRVDQITSGLPVTESRALVVTIRLVGTGSFDAAWEFLRALKSNFEDTSVSAFRLSGNPGEPGQAGAISVELRWFAAPDGTESGAGESRKVGAP